MMNLEETIHYGINEEEDYAGCFFVTDNDALLNERKGSFETKPGGKRIDIYIKDNSGSIPHIHLRDESGNICRIRLKENTYQRDSYEKNGGHRLTKKEEEAFSEYMHSIVPGSITTHWEVLCLDWNVSWGDQNPNKTNGIIDLKTTKCPDYTNIKEPK